MPQQIQLRRGTAAQWATANPTLAAGETGVETDTRKFKVGDGSTAWNSLTYATLSYRGAYSAGTTYYVNDVVVSGGSTYICILTSTGNAVTNTTYWTVLAAKGTDGTNGTNGTNGTSFVFRGEYAAGTAYVANDVVTSGGSAYICILASTGNAPTNTTYWSVLAAKGQDGVTMGKAIAASLIFGF
jgi:hypothetical protein